MAVYRSDTLAGASKPGLGEPIDTCVCPAIKGAFKLSSTTEGTRFELEFQLPKRSLQ